MELHVVTSKGKPPKLKKRLVDEFGSPVAEGDFVSACGSSGEGVLRGVAADLSKVKETSSKYFNTFLMQTVDRGLVGCGFSFIQLIDPETLSPEEREFRKNWCVRNGIDID